MTDFVNQRLRAVGSGIKSGVKVFVIEKDIASGG